jgi:hypothetical protein
VRRYDMQSYEERRASQADREKERTVKIGEIRGRVTKGIKLNDNIRVRIDHIEELSFNSTIDLKNGDIIRVTIEKV